MHKCLSVHVTVHVDYLTNTEKLFFRICIYTILYVREEVYMILKYKIMFCNDVYFYFRVFVNNAQDTSTMPRQNP